MFAKVNVQLLINSSFLLPHPHNLIQSIPSVAEWPVGRIVAKNSLNLRADSLQRDRRVEQHGRPSEEHRQTDRVAWQE
jgi:hypothetical protein